MNATVRNLLAVARREFSVRPHPLVHHRDRLPRRRRRGAGPAPIGIRWMEGERDEDRIVDRADPALTVDPVARFSLLLNASTPEGEKGFEVSSSAARRRRGRRQTASSARPSSSGGTRAPTSASS